nr:glycosyltransferase family 2 protein [Ectothiorhodospira shaposhnikovii]
MDFASKFPDFIGRVNLMTKIKVTAVINTFNRKELLEDAIMSVFKQTSSVCKLIVIDDGSSDGTSEVVAQIAKNAPIPVEYHRYEQSGLYPSRNRGLEAVEDGYIAFLDDDDAWVEIHIERLTELARSFSQAVFLGGLISRPESNIPIMPAPHLMDDYHPVPGFYEVYQRTRSRELEHIFFVGHLSAALIDAVAARRVGGFDSSMKLRGDVLMVWELSRVGDIVLDKRVHAWAKRVPGSLSSGVDMACDPVGFHRIRARACFWQAYAIRKMIDDRSRSKAPLMHQQLSDELIGCSMHLRRAGERSESLQKAMEALKAYPCRRTARNLLGALFFRSG